MLLENDILVGKLEVKERVVGYLIEFRMKELTKQALTSLQKGHLDLLAMRLPRWHVHEAVHGSLLEWCQLEQLEGM